MNHCFLVINLKSSLLKFNGCSPYDIYVSKVTTYMFCHNNNLILSSFMTYLIFLVFLCCIIMCFYVLSSELWNPLRFPHKNDGQYVFTNTFNINNLENSVNINNLENSVNINNLENSVNINNLENILNIMHNIFNLRDTKVVIILLLLKRADGINHYLHIWWYTRSSYNITIVNAELNSNY